MIVATVIMTMVCGASAFDETFERAGEAYRQEDYALAARLYQQLIREGVHEPAVFYNLGNTWYEMDHIGAAATNYERALQLKPGWQDARVNLQQCFARTRRKLDAPGRRNWEQGLFFWHYSLSPGTAAVMACVFWVAFWANLSLLQWRPFAFQKGLAVALACLTVAFTASAIVKRNPPERAVTINDVASVYDRPDQDAVVRFRLYEGDRVSIEGRRAAGGRRPGWLQIQTAQGERGWARQESLLEIGPPYKPFEAEEVQLP